MVDVNELRERIEGTVSETPRSWTADVLVALAELEQLRTAAKALVKALPKCLECDAPAVFEFDKDLGRYVSGMCQNHGSVHPHFEEHPTDVVDWAEPLRALLSLLGGEGGEGS